MSLKILHITRTPSTVDAFLKPLLGIQKSKGHEVELAFGSEYKDASNFGVPVQLYPIHRTLSPFVIFSSIKALAKVIKTGQYDVVVAHMVLVGMIARLAFAVAGRPGKLLYASHGLACYPTRSILQRKSFLLLEKFLCRWTDGMIVLNKHDYDLAVKHKLAGKDKKLFFLKSIGIDCADISRKAELIDVKEYRWNLGLNAEWPVVCYAGRFIRAKGVQIFIKIAKNYIASGKCANFVIAGTGSLESYISEYIRKNNLGKHVKMLGWYDDIIGLLAASDVLCFPTLYEGAPVIVQEAMAAGTVVLTSDVPGPQDLIENNITGLLVKPGDIGAFYKALGDLLQDKQKRIALVTSAQEKAKEFDSSIWTSRWFDVIESVAGIKS